MAPLWSYRVLYGPLRPFTALYDTPHTSKALNSPSMATLWPLLSHMALNSAFQLLRHFTIHYDFSNVLYISQWLFVVLNVSLWIVYGNLQNTLLSIELSRPL